MKHLIITGGQATGKTLLGNWIAGQINSYRINDGQSVSQIRALCEHNPGNKSLVFITNDPLANYENLSKDKFLIIKLTEV